MHGLRVNEMKTMNANINGIRKLKIIVEQLSNVRIIRRMAFMIYENMEYYVFEVFIKFCNYLYSAFDYLRLKIIS